jgi:hypothetical protein
MSVLDRALRVAATRAGAPTGLRFTERQLYYELCRVLQPLHALPRRPRFTLPAPVGYERFRRALHRCAAVPGLITAARRPAVPPPAEVYDYGLPRLLVCQDGTIADMLLENELHMESACPVYPLDGLPADPRLAAALRRADRTTVYVLHDASAAGVAAVAATRRWAGDLPVAALGLRPVHAAALHLFTSPTAPRTVEVAAVNPARLLRTVHRLVRDQTRVRRPRPRLRRLSAAGFLTWPEAP